jgi:hypothetical protein
MRTDQMSGSSGEPARRLAAAALDRMLDYLGSAIFAILQLHCHRPFAHEISRYYLIGAACAVSQADQAAAGDSQHVALR